MGSFAIIQYAGLAVFAYLMGSIPWGLILARKFAAVDVRQTGSKNIGATNVLRTAGWGLGVLTLVGDVSKGAIPVWLAAKINGPGEAGIPIYVAAIALCTFAGHLYPLFLGFRTGGKGVATAAGAFLAIAPKAVAVVLLVFLLAAVFTNRASVGSLSAAGVLSPAVWWATKSGIFTVCALVVAVGIFVRHRENIRRLIDGSEPRIRKRYGR